MKNVNDKKSLSSLVLIFLCFTLLLAGCSKEDASQPITETKVEEVLNPLEVEETASIYKVGDSPKNYTLKGLDEKIYSLHDYKGKALLLVFWSVDCEYCLVELEAVQKHYEKDQGYEIFALNATFEDGLERAKKEVERMNLTFPIPLIDSKEDAQIAIDYDVRMIPHNIFIDKKGVIRKIEIQDMSGEEVIEYLKELSKE